jgi:hypothetical protein
MALIGDRYPFVQRHTPPKVEALEIKSIGNSPGDTLQSYHRRGRSLRNLVEANFGGFTRMMPEIMEVNSRRVVYCLLSTELRSTRGGRC